VCEDAAQIQLEIFLITCDELRLSIHAAVNDGVHGFVIAGLRGVNAFIDEPRCASIVKFENIHADEQPERVDVWGREIVLHGMRVKDAKEESRHDGTLTASCVSEIQSGLLGNNQRSLIHLLAVFDEAFRVPGGNEAFAKQAVEEIHAGIVQKPELFKELS
jgi:hypothetical protein